MSTLAKMVCLHTELHTGRMHSTVERPLHYRKQLLPLKWCCTHSGAALQVRRGADLGHITHFDRNLNQEFSLVLDGDILQAWQAQQLSHGYQHLLQVCLCTRHLTLTPVTVTHHCVILLQSSPSDPALCLRIQAMRPGNTLVNQWASFSNNRLQQPLPSMVLVLK